MAVLSHSSQPQTCFFLEEPARTANGTPGRGLRAAGRAPVVLLLDGTEHLGMLRINTQTDDDHTRQDMESQAALVALLVTSKRVHSAPMPGWYVPGR